MPETPRILTPEEHATASHLETHDRLTIIERRLDRGSERMALLDEAVAENTSLTREIRDVIVAARVGLKVIGGIGTVVKWIGGVAAAFVALYSAWHAVTGGNKP